MAPIIAIVGSDGSGKSTVGKELLLWLRERGPAELCHLGKQSGNLARAIARLPFVGSLAQRRLLKKVKQAADPRGPGPFSSLTVYAFTLRRLRRFRRMLRMRDQGVTILADRFPQLAFPASIDGPGFGRLRAEGRVAKRLATLERRRFEWMTAHRPDLVIRLNVDLATAAARKPDHRSELLALKVAAIAHLTFAGAPIVDIDATRPLPEVLAQAKSAITAVLAR